MSCFSSMAQNINRAELRATNTLIRSTIDSATNITYAYIRSQQVSSNSLFIRGPSSATDNAIVRYDLTTGKLVQDSGVIVSDGNNVSGVNFLNVSGLTNAGHSLLQSATVEDDFTVGGISTFNAASTFNGPFVTDNDSVTLNLAGGVTITGTQLIPLEDLTGNVQSRLDNLEAGGGSQNTNTLPVFRATNIIFETSSTFGDGSFPGYSEWYSTNGNDRVGIGSNPTALGTNHIRFDIGLGGLTAGQILQVHSRTAVQTTNFIVLTNATPGSSGSTNPSTFASGSIYTTNSHRFGVSNIIVSATNEVVLDLQAAQIFNLLLLTNLNVLTFSNNADGILLGRVNFHQDTNGFRSTAQVRVNNGNIETNGTLSLSTNANGQDYFVFWSAQYPTNLVVSTGVPDDLSVKTLTASGAIVGSTTINVATNIAPVNAVSNLYVLGTRYTNSTRRSFVSASAQLNAAAAGTAIVTLYVERTGITNQIQVAAGPLASLVTIEPLVAMVGPGEIYYFADETSGAGASVALVAKTCSRVDL